MRGEPGNMNSIVYLLLRGFLGGVFIYASIGKILHPELFAETISNYQILPDQFVNLVAIILPWLELTAGTCLVIGIWLPGALFIINLLLMVFFGALLSAFVRGLNIECGCFNTSMETLVTGSMAWYLLRDAVLLVISMSIFFRFMRGKKTSYLD